MTIKVLFSINIFIEKFILTWLKYLNSGLKKRYIFECENSTINSKNYEYWFHISSEGELEQVIPFLKYLSNKNVSTLLIYTSPSVQKKAAYLKSEGIVLEVMCFPIVDGSSINLLPLPKYLFMVRYDFFPRLLKIANHKEVKSILLSATVKNKRINILNGFFWQSIYKSFNRIFWATLPGNTIFSDLGINNVQEQKVEYDFRHAQIIERQKLQTKLKINGGLDYLVSELSHFDFNKRIILGSLWASELMTLLDSFDELIKNGYFLYLAPHHLSGIEYEVILKSLQRRELNFCELTDFENYSGESIVLSKIPGILCEIYPLFKHAFVGGGHGRSVHSLLEPYWAGCHVYCGPKVHRSTEYDFILKHKAENIHICDDLSGLEDAIVKCDNDSTDIDPQFRDEVVNKSYNYINELCVLDMDKRL